VFILLRYFKTWMPGTSPGMTTFAVSPCALRHISLIRRNLDQAAVGVAAVDRSQRAARALLGYRTLLDRHAAGRKMRDHVFRRGRSKKAQIVAAGGLVVGGEPLHFVGVARPHIDLLVAER